MLNSLDINDHGLMIIAVELVIVVLSIVQVSIQLRGYSSDSSLLFCYVSILSTALFLCTFAVMPMSPKIFTSSICYTLSRNVLLLRLKSYKKYIPIFKEGKEFMNIRVIDDRG